MTIAQGASQVPFSKENFNLAMGGKSIGDAGAIKIFTCGGNLFWHDLRWRPDVHVPWNRKGLADLVATSYSPDVELPEVLNTIHIAVPAAVWDANWIGTMKRISPAEPVVAQLKGFKDLLEAPDFKGKKDKIKHWLKLFRTQPIQFELIPREEDMCWRAGNIRGNKLVATLSATVRTGLQRLLEISELKRKMQESSSRRVGAKDIYKEFVKEIPKQAAMGEQDLSLIHI